MEYSISIHGTYININKTMTHLRIKESSISAIESYNEHYEQSINEFYFIYIMIIT